MSVVETPLGAIRGTQGRECLEFLGLRYAQAPIDVLRFAPPRPVLPWSDTYDAREFGPSAPQPQMGGADDAPLQLPVEPTDEDCLFLNIYTPATDNGRRPVMFWIHGGGYVAGSGRAYHGGLLAHEHNVVVVTINYRMGALGFMHVGHLAPEFGESVNTGILDQICALEWTRDNIAAFGGDPGNVLIFGESGGDPANNGLETLRRASTDDLNALYAPDPTVVPQPGLALRRANNVTFSPAIDGTLIPRPIAETVRQRGADNVPFLGGGCRHEGTLFAAIAGGECSHDEAVAIFNREGFDGDTAMSVYGAFAPGSTPRQKLVYALTDTMFRNSMVRILDAAAESGARCWSWMCTWESDQFGGRLRATHAMELPFLWHWTAPGLGSLTGSNPPADLGPAMRAYWANFARTGKPFATGEPVWPPYTVPERPVLVLDAERRIANDLDGDVRRFWFE